MNEVEQLYDETLARIVLGLVIIGLLTAILSLTFGSLYSPWFIRGVALLVIATVTYAFRLTGRVVAAAYLLLFQLVGLVAEMALQVDALTTFVPYLLIPIAVIAGALLDTTATLLFISFSIAVLLFVLFFTGQLLSGAVGLFLSPALLALLSGMLTAAGRNHIEKLGRRLEENRTLLKDRTLTFMQSDRRATELEQQVADLQQNLAKLKTHAPAQPTLASDAHRLPHLQLLEATIRLLDTHFRELEKEVENVAHTSGRNGQSPSLERMWKKIDHLKRVVIGLEEVVQIEKGEVELVTEQVDIKQLLADVAHVTQALARPKQLTVQHHLPDQLPSLQADPDRLRQALLHILSNAVTYTDQGLVEINANVYDSTLKITVSDTGSGIDQQEFDRVFERFGHADNASIRERQGVGLGLALAKYIIELHGGRLSVSSVLDVGSEFYIELPIQPAQPEPAKADLLAWRNPLIAEPALASSPTTDTDATIFSNRTELAHPPASQPKTATSAEKWTLPAPPPTRSTPPVSRRGPTYIRRFGVILLVILGLISGLAAVLAYINGPVAEPAGVSSASTRAAANGTLPSGLAASPDSVAERVNSPTPPPTFTATALPDAVVFPTSTSPSQQLRPLPTTASPSPPPTATPLPSATPSPIVTSTSTPPPSPTLQSDATQPSPLSISPAVVAVPGLEVLRLPSSRRVSYIDFDALSAPATTLEPLPNGRTSWSATGRPAFASDQNNDRDIYLFGADGDPLNLTDAVGDDIHPAWSPDGRQIVFSSARTGNFDLYTVDVDDGSLNRLTDSRAFEEWPVWSPDGRRIAFVSDQNGNIDLFVMDADGSNRRQLTAHPADDWPASWSPDGRRLVFASDRDGNWNLYLVSATGGDPVRLTADPADERDPVWSPDGSLLAFTSNRGDSWDIYTLSVAAPVVTEVPASAWSQVTNTPTDERYPAWLPAPANP